VGALRGELSVAERAAVDRQLDRLCGNARETRRQLTPSGEVKLPDEGRMSLAFAAFLMRTRMESYLSAGLREAGMVSGDYALLSLLAVEGQLTPAVLARLVGVARSTLGPRLNSFNERGLGRAAGQSREQPFVVAATNPRRQGGLPRGCSLCEGGL
jgi:hypothetical protein